MFDNLWIEKYRPQNLEELIVSKDTKEKLIAYGNAILELEKQQLQKF